MKFSLRFLIFLVPTLLFALPCPNGNGILYKGDSIQEVLKECGEPLERHATKSEVYSLQEWIYDLPHAYDSGESQVDIIFENDLVSKIHITDIYPLFFCQSGALQVGQLTTIQTSCGNWVYDTSYTSLCGIGFGVGASTQFVESACGEPASHNYLQNQTIETTELIYGGDHPQTIVFQNGKLTDWQ